MAFELNMHKCWPKLLKRMRSGKAQTYTDDRSLVASVRTWFALYIFEHQYVAIVSTQPAGLVS
jgi:hypothetical protein